MNRITPRSSPGEPDNTLPLLNRPLPATSNLDPLDPTRTEPKYPVGILQRLETPEISIPNSKAPSHAQVENLAGNPATTGISNHGSPISQRLTLLHNYVAAMSRQVSADDALKAIRLRGFAETYYKKNRLSRLPGLRPVKAQIDRLYERCNQDPEGFFDQIKKSPDKFNRTILTDLSVRYFMDAANFDVESYKKGIVSAGNWEGVHSTVGRAISFAFSAASFGTAEGIGSAAASAALTAVRKTVGAIAHIAPSLVINPVVTANYRMKTDIKESLKRKGGSAALTENINQVRPMREIRLDLKKKIDALKAANNRLEKLEESSENNPPSSDLLKKVAQSYLDLYEVQREVKVSTGSGKEKTWSKGWGMGVNALGSIGLAVSIAQPIAGLSIQAVCIPLQWFAGRADENTRHQYRWRANVKCGDLLTQDARYLPFDALRKEHVDQSRLRGMLETFPEVKIKLVRESYRNELGELKFKLNCLTNEDASRPEVLELNEKIQEKVSQAVLFESFDSKNWAKLPTDSMIGRCLDDERYLEKQAIKARRNAPGEQGSQILQRYIQAFQGVFVSTAFATIGADVLANIDSISGPNANSAIKSDVQGGSIGLGTLGGISFAASTGHVRHEKAENRKLLAEIKELGNSFMEAKKTWMFDREDNGKSISIDLTGTGGFYREFHPLKERADRVLRVIGRGLFSAVRSSRHTLATRQIRKEAKKVMSGTQDLLQKMKLPKSSAITHGGKKTFQEMINDFYSYDFVQQHYGARIGPSTEGTAKSSNNETLLYIGESSKSGAPSTELAVSETPAARQLSELNAAGVSSNTNSVRISPTI
jgi:hypothetical protein